MKAMILIAVSISLVSSCASQPKKAIVVPLELPPKISVENTLTQDDLKCLSKDERDKVVLLDKRRKTLRSIIKTTH